MDNNFKLVGAIVIVTAAIVALPLTTLALAATPEVPALAAPSEKAAIKATLAQRDEQKLSQGVEVAPVCKKVRVVYGGYGETAGCLKARN